MLVEGLHFSHLKRGRNFPGKIASESTLESQAIGKGETEVGSRVQIQLLQFSTLQSFSLDFAFKKERLKSDSYQPKFGSQTVGKARF